MPYYRVTVTLESEAGVEAEDEMEASEIARLNLPDLKGQYEVVDTRAMQVEKPEDWED